MSHTVLEIDLNALEHNYNYLRSKLRPEVKMLAVVKAYAYGSESAHIAKKLESLGVAYFAVAYASEGIALREAGIQTPILVLHPQIESFSSIIKHCLEPSIYSFRVLKAFIEIAENQNLNEYPVHIKFNTGLNRLGFKDVNEAEILQHLKETKAVKVRSLFSHLVASEDLNEKTFTLKQIETFEHNAKNIIAGLGYTPMMHQSNTSAIINYPQAQFDMVRTGIGLYGYGNTQEEDLKLKPVATLKTIISQIHEIAVGETVGYNRAHTAAKKERTATLPIGHADGISRSYGKGKGYVIINGKKAPIIGNVCMDMIMVNVTRIDCKEGDEVIVFGKGASAVALSARIKSIPYELITAVSQRVTRKIIDESQEEF
ncbi:MULTISPECIES: alanine racemase [unclassified Leeuwenhoekiella]|uniref:alanine racemase n=1 Tax=unclassified Leeuwenhoekiella TaxID=2615029 RepID=UPI000C55529C|nr:MULTISPECIES: alanine racemase [unclassified Leeuwenhoekiella]MAW95942.1 alanine racemase [Leeuwenhoekiella sp.]MBA79936.1 alanine racemase [Leeuwenhoekiella sp.]|tara:strand:- start:9215 stop:10330 length:1116 start_codon:yes stop_codon:yes gene_type:complete